ncbi:D-hexose-6-phosphate mutarotase [Georgenia sp. SUBG003]|uniref:D-hexose-6-phosphate mutarotase n=1 Tax=Georgenia sp. SUBG003 TaxID=1497974 RepID=UPI0004DA24A1|nr:hypothetical protein DA06_09215 [Georgenia sp. SUBG003]
MTSTPLAVDLPSSVKLAEGRGGLPVLDVSTPVATGQLYLHGAHVTAWTPAGQDPVIWMSRASRFADRTAIRGGVPICWPWFGAGREPGLSPAHGFARLANFTLVGADVDPFGAVTLTLRLTDADVVGLPGAEHFTQPFELTHTVTFGSDLTLALSVRNTGTMEYSFEEALHAYLTVKDVTAVTVEGLEGVRYLDKVAGAGKELVTQVGPVTFTGETDRVYHSTGAATVVDPALARTVTAVKAGSADTVVWNPWTAKAAAMADFDDAEWPTMVCVEVANALADAVTLGPGESHTMTARYAVASRA